MFPVWPTFYFSSRQNVSYFKCSWLPYKHGVLFSDRNLYKVAFKATTKGGEGTCTSLHLWGSPSDKRSARFTFRPILLQDSVKMITGSVFKKHPSLNTSMSSYTLTFVVRFN